MLKRYGSHLAAGLFFHDEHLSPKIGKVWQSPTFSKSTCAIVKTWYWYMGYGHPSYIRNHYNGYIKPYWWVYMGVWPSPSMRKQTMFHRWNFTMSDHPSAGCRPCAGRSARWSSTPWGLVPGAANMYLQAPWPQLPKGSPTLGEIRKMMRMRRMRMVMGKT